MSRKLCIENRPRDFDIMNKPQWLDVSVAIKPLWSVFWGTGCLLVESQLANVPRTCFVFDYATTWTGDLCGIEVFDLPDG